MPQVTILEGGKPKSFAGVDKLQIALSGGGTSLWVPKDTRLLTVLTASVNGVYPPPEGYYGFDTAVVDVEPSKTIGINGNGEYVIIESEPTTPNPPDDPPKWPTIPDVPDDPYDPDNPDGHGWDPWEDDNPWDKDEYKDDWGEGEPELTETRAPSGIRIVTHPTKTKYEEGDAISYGGIQVQLLDENGDVFTDSKYPSGYVPYSELVFPVERATEGSFVSWTADSSALVRTAGTKLAEIIDGGYKGRVYTKTNDGKALAYMTHNSTGVTAKGPVLVAPELDSVETNWGRGPQFTFEYQGVTWCVTAYGHVFSDNEAFMSSLSVYNTPAATLNEFFVHAMEYFHVVVDSAGSGNNVPVQWVSPYDGKTYEDKFPITVTKSSSGDSDPEGGGGGFSGGGGGGIGGEGGGGGF